MTQVLTIKSNDKTYLFKCPVSMIPHVTKVFQGEYIYWNNEQQPIKSILDIGANVGAFSLYAAINYPSATIQAYEPNQDNYNLLFENTHDLNVIHHKLAVVSNQSPTITMYQGKNNCGECSIYKTSEQTDETFEARTLHPIYLPDCNYMKVDTEGCEYDIISTYLTCHPKPRIIACEIHSQGALQELLRLLFSENYQLARCVMETINRGTFAFILPL